MKNVSFRIHMGAADYSLTVTEPAKTTEFDLRALTRPERGKLGRMMSDFLGLKDRPMPAQPRRQHSRPKDRRHRPRHHHRTPSYEQATHA